MQPDSSSSPTEKDSLALCWQTGVDWRRLVGTTAKHHDAGSQTPVVRPGSLSITPDEPVLGKRLRAAVPEAMLRDFMTYTEAHGSATRAVTDPRAVAV